MNLPTTEDQPRTPRSSRSVAGEIVKRLFDVVLASIGLLLLSPLLVCIASVIRLTSKGPVFYRGVRTGRYGKPFRVFKFRSMVVDAEQLGGTTTGKDDPRVTKIGCLLRKYKLDELPQLLNVLMGDMSFVGPRPEVQEYTDAFSEEEQRILSVRPGITDFASMEFSDLQEAVGTEDPDLVFREKILPRKNELRLEYVDSQSFFGDLLILMKTTALVATKPFRA